MMSKCFGPFCARKEKTKTTTQHNTSTNYTIFQFFPPMPLNSSGKSFLMIGGIWYCVAFRISLWLIIFVAFFLHFFRCRLASHVYIECVCVFFFFLSLSLHLAFPLPSLTFVHIFIWPSCN